MEFHVAQWDGCDESEDLEGIELTNGFSLVGGWIIQLFDLDGSVDKSKDEEKVSDVKEEEWEIWNMLHLIMNIKHSVVECHAEDDSNSTGYSNSHCQLAFSHFPVSLDTTDESSCHEESSPDDEENEGTKHDGFENRVAEEDVIESCYRFLDILQLGNIDSEESRVHNDWEEIEEIGGG